MSKPSTDYFQPLRTPAQRILVRLKTHGPQTSAMLGQALNISGEAVRQQLQRLAREDMVESSAQAAGVGRPALHWRLTRAGHQRFPDTHPVLVVKLLQNIQAQFGNIGVTQLLDARHAEAREAYAEALAGARDLPDRLAGLARLRSAEGYMCECEEQPDGSWMLIENHCPICAAAAACPGFCETELMLFREILGPDVLVERVEHLQSGGRRCTYRISVIPPVAGAL